ncbi:hypothetical protein E2C01_072134 [Portunus trituberculatus]|uniref:Uncharacterized protein n=1 Tax=Portunus trituberculatus TaxID=210409 RepID=A0A5B7I6D0_PORTR|nr:hypothetical protein [Portunus trituberculatus]
MSLPPSRTSTTRYAVGPPLWPQPHLQRAVLSRAKERVTCASIACATHPRKRTMLQGSVQQPLHPHRGWIPPIKPVKGAT